ncbi:MAG: hypothetical protein ACP5E5_05650 [Acidobacteriaceae bacterium]
MEGRLGRTKEAEQLFLQATENDSQYVQAFINLGLILASESRFSESKQVLQHAVELDPNSTPAHTALAMVLARLGQGEKTVK